MNEKYTKDNIGVFFDYDINPTTRTLYMGSEEYTDGSEYGATATITERFLKGLDILTSVNEEAITVLYNNPGGDWYHGMAVYDAIKSCPCHITCLVYGHAMSMGSIILQAADLRLMAPHASMMLHYGTAGVGECHTKDFIKLAQEESKINTLMENVYLERIKEKHPKFTRQKLQTKIAFDTFLSASEAVDFGLADGIIGESIE